MTRDIDVETTGSRGRISKQDFAEVFF